MPNAVVRKFQETANQFPNETAVTDQDKKYTFQDLDRCSSFLAHSLPDNGQFVGIVLDHGFEMIASLFAVLKTGKAYVPAEPDFPENRIRFMMNESCVSAVLTQKKYAAKLEGLSLIFIEDLFKKTKTESQTEPADYITSEQKEFDRKDPEQKDHCISIQEPQPAYVLYTSGSTGVPKGVVVSADNVVHYANAFHNEFQNGPVDVMLQYSVCSFDIFVEEVFASLLNGAAIYIPDSDLKKDLEKLLRECEKKSVTMISGFPYLLDDISKYELPRTIRLLISGGDILRKSYIENLLGKCEIYNTYGPSETTVCASYYKCTTDNECKDGTYPIGKPVLGAKIRILNDQMEEVPVNVQGEICIFGNGVSLGYLDSSKNGMFIEADDPDNPYGERFYRSGDLGMLMEDGNLAFFRRIDDQVMILGKRVEPKEVESILCQTEGVDKAVVFSKEDEQHLFHLYACVQGSASKEEIKNRLSKDLTYFMIPEYWSFTEDIHLNSNGKPDLNSIRELQYEC